MTAWGACPGWCLSVTPHQVLPSTSKPKSEARSPTAFQKMHQKITMIGSAPKKCIIFSDNTSLCFAYILLVTFFVFSIRWISFLNSRSKHRLFSFEPRGGIRWLKNNIVSASSFCEDALHSLLHSPQSPRSWWALAFSAPFLLLFSDKSEHSVPYSVNWPLARGGS